MRHRIADENLDAEKLIPPAQPDGSGIGVNYTDAYIKPFNTTLEDGRKLTCKRKGLKITMKIGDVTGEAIMNRLEHGADVKNILRQALEAAASAAGAKFETESDGVFLELDN